MTCNPIVYGIYEKILWSQIKDDRIPEHIGVILDGNRRWASKRDLPSWGGHKFGADKVDDLVEWCLDLKVKTVTLYAFSTENFNRPQAEVQELMRVFEDKLRTMSSDERIRRNRVHIRVIGRLNLLPESTQKLARAVEEDTKDFDQHYLNIALAYGGRAEIVDATKKIAEEVKSGQISIDKIDEAMIGGHLYTAYLPQPDPDLIIRTSGEERLSGFLLWQGAYSELCFIDVFWPDFRRIDLWRVIRTYQRRERRRGA
ncbi:MAG: di-trans,poly-cis-decaprenylcistransferase [Elusimicrobia bacterium]|nr:di-trans,poly-cis-decaprenylcistransferase [Elusimicrobiota bacterium]